MSTHHPIGTSQYDSVSFYIIGTQDIIKEAHGVTTSKALLSNGLPVPGGLYHPAYGTTEISWNCQTCKNPKNDCPGHDGMTRSNYPIQNASFRDEILKWLKIVCHNCGEFASPKVLKSGILTKNILGEFVKLVRTSSVKNIKCTHCGVIQPWVSKDQQRNNILWAEYFNTQPSTKKEMYNIEIKEILSRITDQNVRRMGKDPIKSHPRKLILDVIKVPSTVIRPELKKINGNRSTMQDSTAQLKSFIEINNQIPERIPEEVEASLQDKFTLLDMTFYDMVRGSATSSNAIKMVTSTNKVSNSFSSRLPKKTGRIRANLMAKRIRKMLRSVITGDKALRPDQLGLPKKIAMNLTIPEVVKPWNIDRLATVLANGASKYPGCTKIFSKIENRTLYVERLSVDYKLHEGDIVHRHLIDGDTVGFVRSPALTWSSIAVFSVKVLPGLTLRMNSSVCVLFNADFDGDEMNGFVIKNPESICETKMISNINQWFISYQNSDPLLGLFQDSIIGASEMTKDNVVIDKFYAMEMCNRSTPYSGEFKFDKERYTSRELISMFLPDINYEGDAYYHEELFQPYIDYKDTEVNVVIKRGKLLSGVLDKNTIGEGVAGGLFHTIYSEKGASEATECIYNLQQVINHYIYFNGITFGLADIYLGPSTKAKLKLETAKIIAASNDLVEQLENGELVPPVGMSLTDYHEELQMIALEHGDDFIKIIIEDIDYNTNWLYKFVFSGSKGKKSNLMAIFGSIGSIGIEGKRIGFQLNDRTTINFPRYSMDPISRGYNQSNFTEGIDPITFPFAAYECRHELIEIALGTATGGTFNRNAVKNLESIVVSNTRGAAKQNRLVQLIYGETGFDPRKVEKITIPTVTMAEDAFELNYKTKITEVEKKWRNSEVETILNDEYECISQDRKTYRDISLNIESTNRKILMKPTVMMPMNIKRIITDVIFQMEHITKKRVLDPVEATLRVKDYCDTIGYCYSNEIQRKAKTPIPEHIAKATTFMSIYIRSMLCTKNLIKHNIDNELLEIILDRITDKIVNAFMQYGTCVGIIAAQSLSEPITQYFLDAKHRSGLRKKKTNKVVRYDELMKGKTTQNMENPTATIVPRFKPDEFKDAKEEKRKTMELANYIEMLPFSRFVKRTTIFHEKITGPFNPKFSHERKIVQNYQKYSFGDSVPHDLLGWCIRFELNDEELVLKNMKLKTIYMRLITKFPYLYITHTPQTADVLVMRMYIRRMHFNKNISIDTEAIVGILKKVGPHVIRGIDGIANTNVISMPHSMVADDGSIKIKKSFVIETDGTNLSKIIENPYLDAYKCVSNSIQETEMLYGIGAARNKLISELRNTLEDKPGYGHVSIYADEMTYTGRVTSIQRYGLGARETDNILLRASFGDPLRVVRNAAVDAQTDNLYGMSAPIAMGGVPRFGTSFNDIIIDHDRVRELHKTDDDILDDL